MAFGVLQFSPTGLDPVRHAVSEWELGPYTWGYRWFTVSLAVAGAALSVADSRAWAPLSENRGGRIG